MFYYTYVIKSEKDGKLYIGFSENLSKRFSEHQKGLVSSTRYGRPWKLIYYEACLGKDNAVRREKQLKTGFGRAYLKRRMID